MKLVTLIFFLLIRNISNAQQLHTLLSEDTFYLKAWECSGLLFYNDHFYIPAEKCRKILIIDTNGHYKGEIPLDFSGSGINESVIEIEGITRYRDYFLFTDESPNQPKLYTYNLQTRKLDTINTGNVLVNDTEEMGIEGIAIDAAKSICYVLKEKDGNGNSIIRVFKIVANNPLLKLRFIRNVIIKQPNTSWRYSDIFYNEADKKLYCLKTTYGSYRIDAIKTTYSNDTGDISISNINEATFMDITKVVNEYHNQGYDSNMEGLTITKDAIYVVSDNDQTATGNCDKQASKKTLLLKFPRPDR